MKQFLIKAAALAIVTLGVLAFIALCVGGWYLDHMRFCY